MILSTGLLKRIQAGDSDKSLTAIHLDWEFRDVAHDDVLGLSTIAIV